MRRFLKHAALAASIAAAPALAQAASEFELPAEDQARLTALAQAMGFDCPLAKRAYPRGDGPRGLRFKVMCGPDDRPGLYDWALELILDRDGYPVSLKEW